MPPSFAAFFVIWILLGIGSWVFYAKASYETKKSAHPFLMIGLGVVFLLFAESTMGWKLPLIFPLFLVLITFLNIRNTRFCRQCNATLYNQAFTRPRFCSKCGADLDARIATPNHKY